jgi:ribosomal protein S5
MENKKNDPKQKLLEEQVIEIKSVVKVNKGGRQRRFSATVVVGIDMDKLD